MKTFRLELHDPGKANTPALDHLRVVYSDKEGTVVKDEGYKDFPLAEVPDLISTFLKKHQFENARSTANAWFVAMAHLHGYWQVELT